MPRLLIFPLLLPLIGRSQITSPPEFQQKDSFHRGASAAAVDGSSHVSPQRAEVNQELVTRLRAIPDFAEGVRLLEQGMLGPAQEHFRSKRLRLGEAVTLFLLGKTDASAELLYTLAADQPGNPTLLAFLGETIGVSRVWSKRMLASVRKLAAHRTAEGEYYLAQALLKQDPPEIPEALVHLQRSAELDKKGTRALLELARQYAIGDRKPAAILALNEALVRNEALASAHYRLSQLYRSEGELDRSKHHLQRYQELR